MTGLKKRVSTLEKLLKSDDRIFVRVPPELGEDGKCIVTSDRNGQTWYTDEEYAETVNVADEEVIVCFK